MIDYRMRLGKHTCIDNTRGILIGNLNSRADGLTGCGRDVLRSGLVSYQQVWTLVRNTAAKENFARWSGWLESISKTTLLERHRKESDTLTFSMTDICGAMLSSYVTPSAVYKTYRI